MNEFENTTEMLPQNPPKQEDPYTDYAGQPAASSQCRYVPEPKKKKKLPWGLILVIALCCALVGGMVGAGSVLLVQSMQAEAAVPEVDPTYIMQGVR